MKDLFDLYGRKINNLEQTKRIEEIHYVKCDCKHLAIRKNRSFQAIFKCSLCKREYEVRLTGKVRLIGNYK